jgi:hypothetical protein
MQSWRKARMMNRLFCLEDFRNFFLQNVMYNLQILPPGSMIVKLRAGVTQCSISVLFSCSLALPVAKYLFSIFFGSYR